MHDKCHHPAFSTNPPQQHREEPNYQPQIWKGKVTAINAGGNAKLVQVVKCDGAGDIVGTTTYTIMQTASPAVGDVIKVAFIRGGTGQLYNSDPVYFEQLAGGGSTIVGNLKWQVFTTMDDFQTTGWDWVRAHAVPATGG